jgi:hypothetical protein
MERFSIRRLGIGIGVWGKVVGVRSSFDYTLGMVKWTKSLPAAKRSLLVLQRQDEWYTFPQLLRDSCNLTGAHTLAYPRLRIARGSQSPLALLILAICIYVTL